MVVALVILVLLTIIRHIRDHHNQHRNQIAAMKRSRRLHSMTADSGVPTSAKLNFQYD
jgi:hypothetical protein